MAIILGRKGGGAGGGGGAPSGPAGGDLGGNYPDPTLSVAKQAEIDGKVPKSLYEANTVLAANSDDTPAAVTMGASTTLARLAAGNIKAASVAEMRTLYDVPTNAQAVLQALADAKGDLIAATAADTFARVAVGATNGMHLEAQSGQSAGVAWALPPGFQLDYVERTTNLTVSATTPAGADTFITGTTQAYAATKIKIEVWVALADARQFIQLQLWDGSTDLGCIGATSNSNTANAGSPVYGVRYLTPSAASHTYTIKAWRGGTNGTLYAASGGTAGEHLPAFVRVSIA